MTYSKVGDDLDGWEDLEDDNNANRNSQDEEDGDEADQRDADDFEIQEEEQTKYFKTRNVKRGKCFAHTLQLPVVRVSRSKKNTFGKTLKKTKTFVAKVSKSTKAKYFLKNNTSFKKRLKKMCQRVGILTTCKLKV